MKIENVLEIEYMPVFDNKFIVRIRYQNTDVLKRGDFLDDYIKVESLNGPNFMNDILFLRGNNHDRDCEYAIISEFQLNKIIKKVEQINKKYGIKIRERVGVNEQYYFISSIGDIRYTYDTRSNIDNSMFESGNYFYTKEDAENSEIYKGFQKQKEDLKSESGS